jgi:predicted ATPase
MEDAHRNSKIKRQRDQDAFEKILSNFGITDKEVLSRTNAFFELADKTNKRLLSKDVSDRRVELDDIFAVAYSTTIHGIVEKWSEVTKEREALYSWQEIFRTILNDLFYRKEVLINERNELQIELSDSGHRLYPVNLSSGEKQLLVILGEALLQRQRAAIYIADEPELSLHIEWQEKLVNAILHLNPSAQVIFATHSPDIIGKYRKQVLDMAGLFDS